MKKHITANFMLVATALASQAAWALGFGRVVSNPILGQPLQFSAPVHLEEGEHFGQECVTAEVYFGESRVPSNEVQAIVEPGASVNDWVVKVITRTGITEPIVDVVVNAGCDRRFVRRFTAFADPPGAATAVAQLAQGTEATPAAAPASATDFAPVPVSPAPGSHAAVVAGPAAPARPHKGPTLALARELNARGSAKHGGTAARGRHAAPEGAAVAEPPARLVLDNGYASLKLDMDDPVVTGSAGSPASGALALGNLDDATAKQLRQLEQSIQAMKRDNQLEHEQFAHLQAQLSEAQSRGDWLPYVLGLLALALAVIAALALKMREQARLARSAWFAEPPEQGTTEPMPLAVSPTEAETEPAPEIPPFTMSPEAVPERAPIDDAAVVEPSPIARREEPARAPAPPPAQAQADMASTLPLGRSAMAGVLSGVDGTEPRELSVEELLDLEQQADFFIALGQEDAAVDLLMSHLRSAGGQSPLPYTKLLEIYRRQEDRAAYERMRARFNRRFNAYAPDWDTGPAAGRLLEDYPETIARLQATWFAPIDAMAILESLLFKRDEASEVFDLPAYRDVLLLYSIARDLWHHGGGPSGTPVDVLLPLPSEGEAGATLDYAPVPPSAEAARRETGGFHRHDAFELELPLGDDDVHATLVDFGLVPVEPVSGAESPSWDRGHGDDGPPTPKSH